MRRRNAFCIIFLTLLVYAFLPVPSLKAFNAKKTSTMQWNYAATDTLSSFAYASNDSVELVIGVHGLPLENYIKLTELTAKYGAKVINGVSFGNEPEAIIVNLSAKLAPLFAQETETANASSYVEPNLRFKADFTPNDNYWLLQWGPAKIGANYAWNKTVGNHSVLVAEVDTGIDYTHADLAANYVPLGYDWVNHDSNPMDDNEHGTHVAGIIAAVTNNGFGIAGLAQVSIMAEKGLDATGTGYETDLANAIAHATNQGAKIISMSWGSSSDSTLIHNAIIYAYNHGVLLVAAAGNDATNQMFYPAAYPEVIAVTATDQSDAPAYFTNYGNWVELAAPGTDIYSTLPGNSFGYLSGTSMAAPHVSGVAALVWSFYPNETRDEVRMQLRATADDLGTPGFDEYYGYGRIDAKRALEVAHNIVVKSVSADKTVVGKGYGVSIYVNVTNQDVNPQTFSTAVYVNSTVIQTRGITLSGENSTTIVFTWNTGAYPMGSYILSANASFIPSETNKTDNTATGGSVTVTVPGDVDGNFRVDVLDLVKITSVYSLRLGDARFNSNSDVDGDGVITILDVTICASHYGEKMQP